MPSRRRNVVVALGLFAIAFFVVPFEQLAQLSMMPGDVGDARLVNYFLENIYQFVRGRTSSLVDLEFFYPFPWVLGFSDNLFGSSPVYIFSRAITGQTDTAYQIWYLLGYFFNFVAAYYSLCRLEVGGLAAAVGALIYAFALPVTVQSGHAQLHYRFAVPLSITMFLLFLTRKNWQYFIFSLAWMVWQFYCVIYIGFFLLLFLGAIFCIYTFNPSTCGIGNIRGRMREFAIRWRDMPSLTRNYLAAALVILVLLLALLFYPYLKVNILYSTTRSIDEIATMLPRPQSYLLSDNSYLWSWLSKLFSNVPMRHEHQMFVGAIPMFLAIIGFFVGSKKTDRSILTLLGGGLLILIMLTLSVGGVSVWFFFARLPLASAIRAVTRIVLVFIFPIAYFSSVTLDGLIEREHWGKPSLFLILIPLLIFEFSATAAYVSSKEEWRSRLIAHESAIPAVLPKQPILFFAQSSGPFYADELDAMWVSLRHGYPTLNGYSGNFPPGYTINYGNDCSELPRRIISYLQFNGEFEDAKAYRSLAERVVPIGFTNCDPSWLSNPPPLTISRRVYTADEFKALSIQYIGRSRSAGRWYVDVRIRNSGDLAIAAVSAVYKPVRISWRAIDATGDPLSGWDTRKDLTFDVPAYGSLDIRIPIEAKFIEHARALEFSLVQEAVFWGHDIGIKPLLVKW